MFSTEKKKINTNIDIEFFKYNVMHSVRHMYFISDENFIKFY